jgi:anti-sigma B factor antagonist
MSLVNEELRVVVGAGERGVCVKVEGELDLVSARLLCDVLDAAVDSEGGDVDVDMSSTTFCNSAGLAVLLTAQRQLQLIGRRLRIVHASRSVQRPLDLLGMRRLLGSPSDAAAVIPSGQEVADLQLDTHHSGQGGE